MGFALSHAAGASSDALEKLLTRKFFEQIQTQRLNEDARQADLRNVMDIKQLEATEGLRRDTLAATQQYRDEMNKDRDAAREQSATDRAASRDLVNENRHLARIRLLPKGSRITGEQAVEFGKYGTSPLLKPAVTATGEPEFEFGGTQDTAEAEARAAALLDQRNIANQTAADRLAISQALLGLSQTRTGWGPPTIQIHTTDDAGNPITKVTTREEATGRDYAAGPTTSERDRQSASRRAGTVLGAISELSEKINTGKGVAAKAQGEVARKAAQVNLNDDVSEYEAVVSGFTPILARAVGHVGVLTEQDVQSVRRMLPQPGDSKSVRDRKIARINSLMGDMGGPAAGGAGGGRGGPTIKSITEIK